MVKVQVEDIKMPKLFWAVKD